MLHRTEETMMKHWLVCIAALALACSGSGKEQLNNGSADTTALDQNAPDALVQSDTVPPEDLVEEETTLPPTDATQVDATLPEGCCLTAAQCQGDDRCVGLTDGPGSFAGQCVAPPLEYECWSNDDCQLPDTCHNASICGCMELCQPQPGMCLHPIDPPNCCHSNDECMGAECIGMELGAGGTCEAPPAAGSCYYNGHCAPGEYCVNQSICSCDMNCISEPGFCVAYNVNCCFDHADCEAGQICSSTDEPNAPGVCKDQPPAGHCWDDQHCKPGEVCQGSSICPCDADCMLADQPGTCTLPCDDNDCCCDDADCGEGSVCVAHNAGNVCLPEQPGNMCWQDSDCGDNGFCQGANVCACQWDCDADGGDIPGTCLSTNGDTCCMTDADCPQFFMGDPMFCHIEDGNPFVVGTCQPMAPPGKCWSDNDCYMLQTCQGAGFCPCGMDCEAPGTTMGDCTPVPPGCCYFDDDCGDGLVCRGTQYGENMPGSCVPDPNGPQCAGDAQCCWDNGDCGSGTCNGASVCGCIELCPVCGACQPDQMGFCA
jgi:hypothetical protein